MKKLTTLWMMIVMLGITIPAMGAMSTNKMRQNARFLTDRMAYELHLNDMQYADVYEVNYDFINNVRYIMDDVVRGYGYAIDRYYEYLNYRNDDLRWILSSSQYHQFMGADYFYRPIYTTHNNWLFRIYKVYHNVNHFYFKKPHHYKSYNGGHFRSHFGNISYYKNHRKDHYHHEFYQGNTNLRPHKPEGNNNRPRMDMNKSPRPSRQERNNQNVRSPQIEHHSSVKKNERNQTRRSRVMNRSQVERENRKKSDTDVKRKSDNSTSREGMNRRAVRNR